jgi:hypothetical protein
MPPRVFSLVLHVMKCPKPRVDPGVVIGRLRHCAVGDGNKNADGIVLLSAESRPPQSAAEDEALSSLIVR